MLKFDGQKTIWLQQFHKLPREKFNLQYTTFMNLEEQPNSQHMIENLRLANVPLTVRGLPKLSFDELEATNEYGFNFDDLLKDSGQADMSIIVDFLMQRLEAADHILELITPAWARKTWVDMVAEITLFSPDILVFANAREVTDQLLTTAARIAGGGGIKIVMELPNLFPKINIDAVDAVVAPSHFAALHESVRSSRKFAEVDVDVSLRGGGSTTTVHVINPGVDTSVFSLEGPMTCLGGCGFSFSDNVKNEYVFGNSSRSRCGTICVTVGFVGRLASEKSPGLFIQVAARVLELEPFAQFVVVGEGKLRKVLEQEADFLGITSNVRFLGALYGADLTAAMRGVDIIVNPSMRFESETFCIANLEAMALGIPIVSFGIGGK